MLNTLLISYDLHSRGDEGAVLQYLHQAVRATDSFYVWTTQLTPLDVVLSLRDITRDRISIFVFDASRAEGWQSFAPPEVNDRVRLEVGKRAPLPYLGYLPGQSLGGRPLP
jgi:hypothetical protein